MSTSLDSIDLRRNLWRCVARNLTARCNVSRGQRLLVGVSGGADSVALLRLLLELAPELRCDLHVAHFDHRMRRDSAEDAEFVRTLAAAHGVDFHLGAAEATATTARGETKARTLRRTFLLETAASKGCDACVLGHQLEDQIETVLMRLGRGTGARGLLGIAWRTKSGVPIVRPLLNVRRAALRTYLDSIEQTWREDPTNRDLGPARNRVRHLALGPLEEALGNRLLENWSASIDDLRDIVEWLDSAADELLRRASERRLDTDPNPGAAVAVRPAAPAARTCDRETLRCAPPAVCRAALQRWLESAGCRDFGRGHITAAMNLIENGQSGQVLSLPGHFQLALEQRQLTLVGGVGRRPDDTTEHGTRGLGTGELGTGGRGTRGVAAGGMATRGLDTGGLGMGGLGVGGLGMGGFGMAGLGAAGVETDERGASRSDPNGSSGGLVERRGKSAAFAAETAETFVYHVDSERVAASAARSAIERERAAPEDERVNRDVPPFGGGVPPDATEVLVAADDLSPPFETRPAESGERVELLGAPGSRKLARLLQDRHVPARLRSVWPLVADARGIIWIPGIGIAERCRLRPESQRALRLRLRRHARTEPPA